MLHLVVDTNLFHEFRPLKELPWADLSEPEEIVLIVTDVVQTELDEHKKSTHARTKRTAIKVVKQFRDMILAGEDDLIIQESAPRVILRLDDTSSGSETYEKLDLSVLDDQLAGISKKIADRCNDGSVHLFSDDIRPLRKAKAIGVPILPIPIEWRRQEDRTDDDIERERLKRENDRLRLQEPILKISCNVDDPIQITLSSYPALTEDEIEELMDILLQANPIETDFKKDIDDSSSQSAFGTTSRGITQSVFKEVSPEKIEAYIDFDYPDWVSNCRDLMADAHNRLYHLSRQFDVTITLSNNGTRPADDVLFTVKSRGALSVMPPPYRDEDDEEEITLDRLRLPPPPSAPQGKWEHRNLVGSVFRNKTLSRMHTARPLLEGHPFISPTSPKRDPNAFFYRDRPSDFVSQYELTCSQFRHAGKEELFECHCFAEGIANELDGKNALIEVTAEAANMSDPVTYKIGVQFSSKQFSTYDAVLELIERHKLGFPFN